MEVNGYRVFNIDTGECIEYIINLIKTTSAEKLALLVHNSSVIKNNLDNIKKTVDGENKDVVFINPDNKLKDYIEESGFTVYDDLQVLENRVAASSEEEKHKFPGGLLSLLGIILIFVLGWIYFYYPAATIVIKPQTAAVKQEIKVLSSPEQEKIDWENNILPLHKFEVTLTDEEQIEASGKKKIGKTKASGKVRFINEGEKSIKIPGGTVLISKTNKEYKTLNDVTVPPVKIDYLMDVQVGRKAGQIEVGVEALAKGTQGNTAIGNINRLAQPRENIHVINPEPIRGGENTVKTVVTAEDIKKLQNNLAEKMKTRLLNKIYQKLSGNFRLIENEIDYSEIKYNIDNKAGDITAQIEGSATIVARGYLLRNNELDRLVTNIFQNNLKESQKLLSSGIIIKNLKLAEKSDGLYNIIMESVGPVVPGIDIDRLTEKIKGNNLETARKLLSEDKKVSEYKIKTRNNNNNLPGISFAIKVVIDEPGARKVINLD